MAQPPLQHHCKDCGLFFDSGKSLDVHLQYHKENLLSKWGNSSGEESNNNNVKPNKSPRVAAVPADSSDSVLDRFSPNFNFPVNRSTPPTSYHFTTPDMRPPSVGQEGNSRPNSNFNANAESDFILGSGSGFPQRRSPPPTSPSHHLLQTSSSFRYHPYQQSHYTHQDQRNGGVSSSSPNLIPNQQTHQCEKCGYVCDNPTLLLEHIQSSHPPSPPENFNFSNDYMRPHEVKIEPQAEILDLDSHKVHVYQPPQGEEGSQNSQSSHLDPGMVPWMSGIQDKKLYHPMHINGSGMPSPDFNVSTTTLNSPELPHHQSYQYEHHINSTNQLPPQITSSQITPIPQKQSLQSMQKSSNNASWKSNEARRPKTYNCTACNKWFTSSGHLKRHYNTTLHKNAVKQSGIPDPANLPVSNHHHPPKDPAPPFPPHQDSPPSQMEENQMLPVKMEENSFDRPQHHLGNGNNFLSNPPNSMAGPSEVTGGLLLHSTQFQHSPEEMRPVQHTLPHMQQHQNFLPFPGAPHPTYPQGMTMYPNLQPPHVSSIQQTATNNIIGNFDVLEQNIDLQIWGRNGELKNQLIALAKPVDNEPLPSFSSHFAHNFNGLLPFSSIQRASDTNVGGLSPSRVSTLDSFYPSPGPIAGLQISNIHTLEEEKFSPSSDSNTLPPSESGSFDDTSYPSPDTALPSSSEDIMEKPIELDHIKMEDNSVSSTMSDRETKTPPIRCIDCDKVFNKACYLTQHNKSFHTGARPYKCEKCGKRFECESQHQEHLSKHAGDKPFKCEICPKQFNHKTDLRRHMCLHSGSKPFSCNICGKGFIRKDHMVKHCDTHKKKHAIPPQMKVLYSAKCVDTHLPLAVHH